MSFGCIELMELEKQIIENELKRLEKIKNNETGLSLKTKEVNGIIQDLKV